MVKQSEYENLRTECFILLSSLRATAEFVSDLLGNTGVCEVDDNDDIISTASCADENLATVCNASKQISSFADRLTNKLKVLKKMSSSLNKD